MPTVPVHRPRYLLSLVVIVLAAIPPLLVFSDRWFGNDGLADMWRDVWCRSQVLCALSWRPYFVLVLLCVVGVIALVKIIGIAEIAPKFDTDPPETGSTVTEAQRRLGVMLIVAGVIGVLMEVVRLALAPTVPGWDYILICVLYVGGWFLLTIPLAKVERFLRSHWLLILAYLLGLAAVAWLLFGLYARNQVTLFALLFVAFAALVLFWVRRRVDPGYYLVLLALVVFSWNLNAWNFITIGDE